MPIHASPFTRLLAPVLAFLLLLAAVPPAVGCTIFVLTDAEHTLFCNNEDWSEPRTRIWFVPAGRGWWPGRSRTYGCVFVGFPNGTPQGGMNTEGLAYDWVAGYSEKWERRAHPELKFLLFVPPPARMLHTCATVEQAIAFFRTHWDSSFAYARILVADRSGASAIISARDNQLVVEMKTKSHGFGYAGLVEESRFAAGPVPANAVAVLRDFREQAGRRMQSLIRSHPAPTPENAALILQAARQQGKYATRYANVFDLKTGDVQLYPRPGQPEAVKFNLHEELKKGGRRWDMPVFAKTCQPLAGKEH